jgi:hypothetical protein
MAFTNRPYPATRLGQSFLAYELEEFYQAKVFEHAGKKAEVINAY